MHLIRSLVQIDNKSKILPPLCLTIGNFDGLHLAHLRIIKETQKIATQKNLASGVLTFEPHPSKILNLNKKTDFRIFGNSQKIATFQGLGLNFLIILRFQKSLQEHTAEEFIEKILIQKLNVSHLVIGHDFTFGKNRCGNIATLENYSFGTTEISAIATLATHSSQKENEQHIENSSEIISSTAIRAAIANGEIKKASEMMGRKFKIDGRVINGKKLARKLGFPTLNLMAKPHIIKPKFGVYKTTVFIPHLQEKYLSITNFGIKPTIDNQGNIPIFETHIPNFSEEIYGKKVTIEFDDFLREEKKFSNIDDLRSQISLDLKRI